MRKLLLLFVVFTTIMSSAMAQKTITGKVIDNSGAPLPGVTVVVKEIVSGTITNTDGVYSISIPENAKVLMFSFIGMKTKEVEISNQTIVNVTMEPDVIGLEEVVAIGYGTVKKKDLTGAVTQVDAEKLEAEATSNMTDLLRANVPGLNVNFSTSAKGLSSASSMEVRGETNLRGSGANAPLIVVDGMIYYGDLADINPNDIDAFDILKDASSAAIYGSRASNGVIIITTKKGKKGKPTINVSASVGLATRSSANLDLMNGEEFIQWRIAGFEANQRGQVGKPGYYYSPDNLPDGVTADAWKAYDGSSEATDLTQIWLQRIGFSPVEVDNYKNGNEINWYDHYLQTGLRQDYNISLSGSTDNLSYYWSLGYVNNEGVVYNEKFETYRSRLNLEGTVTDFLKVGINTAFSVRDESNYTANTDRIWYNTPYSEFYEGDTNVISYAPSGNASMSSHPYIEIVFADRLRDYNSLNNKIYGTLTLPYGFSFTSEYITRFNWNRDFYSYSSEYTGWAPAGGYANRSRSNVFEWQVNNILKWNKSYGEHDFDFTAVQNAEKYQYWSERMYRSEFLPNDVLGWHNMGAGTKDEEISSDDQYSTADALMARLNYTYKDRYLFTGSYRRDGYSAFGQKHPRANFGSVALGWTVSDEDFFDVSWMDLLKLRASFGTNGNRAVGRYEALSDLYSGRTVLTTDGTANYASYMYVNRMANPDLQWERTSAYNFGLDFSTFNGRLRGNFELYLMQTRDLLVSRKLPDITGYSSVFTNLGQVDNRGFELGLNSINIDQNDFQWSSNFTLSHNRNEIVSLYGDLDENGKELDDPTNKWFIGHALDQIWDYETDGIWQEDEAEEAAKYSLSPGDYKIIDQLTEDTDGDGIADATDGVFTNDDKIFQGYSKPKFRATFRNDFSWKNWTASIKMYSYLGYWKANNYLKGQNVFYDRGVSMKVPYWTPENPSNKWASIESGTVVGFNVYEKNSFVRIDNVALTYNIPQNVLNKIKVQRCTLSLIAQNPFVWAPNWSWMDPENNGYTTPSYYTLKLNLTL
ncbi:SusC/RagA family TonB-linked outer membrane protein [Maribellus luteus]|uniref:SusC/RagA family TonB-linked outer membrane protein n=1 Tax=Maribellus luteus TaxID=2305463 RepID=A0A399T4V1_9BACT|nr:SusC/RagA family TonB-linked outer membrane protein [Maribellus luteus]RIJ49201.1 SusC/RagA family TonB-linked outer membrane protein [Maribellus luteus]